MKFNSFDQKMRVYETNDDRSVLPGVHMIVRLDGRGFTKLTERMQYQKPFDLSFCDIMTTTMKEIFDHSSFRFLYGYTQSDEISLLIHRDDNQFNRKTRKIISTLAGEASGAASLYFGQPVSFDARISQMVSLDNVVDYFRWRQQDAERNALNGYAYWTLVQNGKSKRAASKLLLNQGVAFKNELLFQHGINFNDVPNWQKRGVGVSINHYTKQGLNPLTNEVTFAERKRNVLNFDLPYGEDYSMYIDDVLYNEY